MAGSLPKAVLVLGPAPELPIQWEARLHRAEGPLTAARLLTELKPDLVVVECGTAWARSLMAALPSSRRPATLCHGAACADLAELADDWIHSAASSDELLDRALLALARGRRRRQSGRRVMVDPLTQLPNRRAVVAALVRESAHARRLGGELSLLLMDLDP
jgi:hypothetical protein